MRIPKALMPALLAVPLLVTAQENAGDKDDTGPNVVPPPPPEALTQGEDVEPEVNIVRRQWAVFEEYSVNGRVYAVKVNPSVGPAYYLYDADGDGALESRRNILGEVPQTHRWKILTW